ncbi:hypothetical protein ACIQ9E_00725 [Streptomyces sp. NPDC094448]|uniref:hypothetical protein n=1 Tax=Streptomyces sp. NPDC094448 TaxID=3366063 RepID=UPI003812DDB5
MTPPPGDFLKRWVHDNAWLTPARRELLGRWVDDPTPREEVAEQIGVPLGELLRAFNHTGPISPPVGFRYRSAGFAVTAMEGTCDDIADGRYPQFGSPVTLRCYLADAALLPQGMLEAADWNFMDAGRPGFLGYAYGVRSGETLYLAGVQSDIAVRYSYLFQGRGGETERRVGDDVRLGGADDPAADYADYVPVLRRTFQRYWIQVMLGAVAAWAGTEPDLTELGLLDFPLTSEEDTRGHVVQRVYRELPDRMTTTGRCVRVADSCHPYTVAHFDDVARYLGDRWKPDVRPAA